MDLSYSSSVFVPIKEVIIQLYFLSTTILFDHRILYSEVVRSRQIPCSTSQNWTLEGTIQQMRRIPIPEEVLVGQVLVLGRSLICWRHGVH